MIHNSEEQSTESALIRESKNGGSLLLTLVSTYDALNRLKTLTENGRLTSYRYDLNGNIRQLELANAQTIVRNYDALNGLISLSSPLYVYGYTYDLARNLKHSDWPDPRKVDMT